MGLVGSFQEFEILEKSNCSCHCEDTFIGAEFYFTTKPQIMIVNAALLADY
jgi:hypothetical protein